MTLPDRYLPTVEALGLLFIADPHMAGTPPGQRLAGYTEQVLTKLTAALEHARVRQFVPVIVGDLFHWPRENPNSLLVALIELLRPYRPWVLVGNHDKYLTRYTPDVSLAVLEAAGAVRVMAKPGAHLRIWLPEPGATAQEAVLGASPDMTPIPTVYQKKHNETVVWATHHNIGFRDYEDKYLRPKPIPGVDWVINGHLHRAQPTRLVGNTRWANPGSLVRIQFVHHNLERQPTVAIWQPRCEELELIKIPCIPFYEVFPKQELPDTAMDHPHESLFLAGLERLAWRRTQEGLGLRQFLTANLNPELPETRIIWQLYENVTHASKE
ncbi:Metallophos_2 domain-containing protein [Desulfovibrionales bacterium]